MNNKRHAHSPQSPPSPPRAPSLDPDTGAPVPAPVSSSTSGGPAAPAASAAPSSQGGSSELDVWKDRYLRLAADFENFRKRTARERAEAWQRAQAELVSRLADALDDLSRFTEEVRAAFRKAMGASGRMVRLPSG